MVAPDRTLFKRVWCTLYRLLLRCYPADVRR